MLDFTIYSRIPTLITLTQPSPLYCVNSEVKDCNLDFFHRNKQVQLEHMLQLLSTSPPLRQLNNKLTDTTFSRQQST
jgi:hypothetical protein